MNILLWKNNIKEAVKDIADKNFQEEAWFGKGDYISSPDELYCTLFDDFIFEDFLENDEAGLTDTQKRLGYKLISALESYSPKGQSLPEPGQMINDPEWSKVRDVAQAFFDSLE